MIPTEIVEMLDCAYEIGVDTSIPPRGVSLYATRLLFAIFYF